MVREHRPRPRRSGAHAPAAVLTRRERETASLVAKGLTNREIANTLVVSERTAEFHVEQIRNKLGFRSRAEIATWVAEQGLLQGAEPASQVAPRVRATPRLVPLTLRPRWMVASAVGLTAIALVSVVFVVSRPGSSGSTTIRTIAGTGNRGMSADGTNATRAELTVPLGMAADAAGDLYFVDGNRVRKIAADGTVRTVAGTGEPGYSGDGGPATSARLNAPQALALDGEDSLYVTDTLNNRVRKVEPSGGISTVVGTGEGGYSGDGGPAVLARLNSPVGLAVGFGRSLFVADTANHRVRRIEPSGRISTAAGTGELGYAGDGGPATSAPLISPQGLAFDSKGNLYIADPVDARIRKVDASGTITTVAGTGVRGFSGDGSKAVLAQLSLAFGPPSNAGQDLAVDSEGNLYVADTTNHRVRKVSLNGIITTVAGTGMAGFKGDGGPATEGQFNVPIGLAVDPDGGLYIADAENNRIRKVD